MGIPMSIISAGIPILDSCLVRRLHGAAGRGAR